MAINSTDQPPSRPQSKELSNLENQTTAEHDSVILPTAADDAFDPVDGRKIIRRIDFRLIPLLAFLYMLTFLDRVNIGNARLWNMERDLGMTGYDYNISVLG